MPLNGYFITGTGTGVGKTYVAASIARRARQRGVRVFAFKPIETGCRWVNSALIGSDQTILSEAAGGWQTGALAGLYQFEPPVAPSVASRGSQNSGRAGAIDMAEIQRVFEAGVKQADFTLVEGAGGWRVPINDASDMSTLAKKCGLPVIVVATATLGTINHSLLTIEAVERDGLRVAGLVLSKLPEDDAAHAASNMREIQSRWRGRVFVLSHPGDLDVFHVEHVNSTVNLER